MSFGIQLHLWTQKHHRLQQELTEANNKLTQLSITDELTGLFNVRHLKSKAKQYQKMFRRYPKRTFSLAMIDVDQFKAYNDQLGHLSGDQLLVILGTLIQKEIRQDLDFAFRYGGDEFVLFFPDTTSQETQVVCERLVGRYRTKELEGTSLSIGIAEYKQIEGFLEIDRLIHEADKAMYTVKCQGGDGISVF
jgi:diguanylate cyclase (GGDEF)-like protein